MTLLIDTHVLVWWSDDPVRFSRRAAKILADLENRILVSPVVGWELAIKVSIGKIKPRSILNSLPGILEQEMFSELPITLEDAIRAGLLPRHRRDPFDRILVAQAQSLQIPILSADEALDEYGVKRLW